MTQRVPALSLQGLRALQGAALQAEAGVDVDLQPHHNGRETTRYSLIIGEPDMVYKVMLTPCYEVMLTPCYGVIPVSA